MKNSNVVSWWRSLPWYLRIPAIVVLVGAAVVFVLTIGGRLVPRRWAVSGNPYLDGVDARTKSHEAVRGRAKEEQARAEVEIDRGEKKLEQIEKGGNDGKQSVDACGDNIECIDSVLQRERERRSGRD